MRRFRLPAYIVLYGCVVWALYLGVRRVEVQLRNLWFDQVTRRLVTKQSQVALDNCLLGVYMPALPWSMGPLGPFEDSVGIKMTLVSFYQAWGSSWEHQFNPLLMDAVTHAGKVPVVTWEPWVSGFDLPGLRPLPQREIGCLRDIANGAYDGYVREWARGATAWGKPFFLRFAHEMTNDQYPWGPANGNTAQDYRQAWWHVKALFDSLGASNVIWVWCPYGTGTLDYYPGSESVDWVAMDVFNYGELLFEENERRWMSFDELATPLYRELYTLRKPIMLAEVASSDIGGSREVWYREMLQQIHAKFTSIKAVVFFENPTDRTSGRWEIDWSIAQSSDILSEVRPVFSAGHYVHVSDYAKLLSNPVRRK